MMKKILLLLLLTTILLTGCEGVNETECSTKTLEISEAVNDREEAISEIVYNEKLSEKDGVYIRFYMDEDYNQYYYLVYDNGKEILIPGDLCTDAYTFSKILKVTEDSIFIYTGKLLKFDCKKASFENLMPNVIRQTNDSEIFWWMDSECNGKVFNLKTEETVEVSNVTGITKNFPGFYVKDGGIETLNGNIVPAFDGLSEETIFEEGNRIKCQLENLEEWYTIEKNDTISFKYSEYKITNAPENAKVMKILYEEKVAGYSEISAVLLEEDKLLLYDLKKGTKAEIADNVMPRTICSSYNNLLWVDKDYTGHIIVDMYNSFEIQSFEKVLDTAYSMEYWNSFLTLPSDPRLEEYESYGNNFVVK